MDMTDWELVNVYCRPDVGDSASGYIPAHVFGREPKANPKRSISWYELFMQGDGRKLKAAGASDDEVYAAWQKFISGLRVGVSSGDVKKDEAENRVDEDREVLDRRRIDRYIRGI
jgi:hypothetical protein